MPSEPRRDIRAELQRPAESVPPLSVSLPGPRELSMCQACMATAGLMKWMECDTTDKPQLVVVILCQRCSGELIEPHPRLYRQLEQWEPMPGAMPLCRDCRHHENLFCRNPQAQINGGPGLQMAYPRPSRVHICGGPNAGWRLIWQGPVTACRGHELETSTEEIPC